MKRTGFARKTPAAYTKAERVAPVLARLTVKVNAPRVSDEVVTISKEAAIYSEPYRRLVAAMPCINCHIEGYSQAAHPPPTGKGRKEDDRLTFALCCVRPGITGCHADFDQYRLVHASTMRSLAGRWGVETRQAIFESGQWPKNLPKLDELELI